MPVSILLQHPFKICFLLLHRAALQSLGSVSVSQSVYLSVYRSVCLCLPVSLSICPCLSVSLSVSLFVSLSVCPCQAHFIHVITNGIVVTVPVVHSRCVALVWLLLSFAEELGSPVDRDASVVSEVFECTALY